MCKTLPIAKLNAAILQIKVLGLLKLACKQQAMGQHGFDPDLGCVQLKSCACGGYCTSRTFAKKLAAGELAIQIRDLLADKRSLGIP